MRKTTGEKEVFDKIWMDREHVSEISGINLDQFIPTFYFNFFAHIACKKDYPLFRNEDFNIMLLTPREHMIYDSGNKEKREQYEKDVMEKYGVTVRWDYLYAKKDAIIEAYKDIHGSKIVPRDFPRRFYNASYGIPEGDLETPSTEENLANG